MTNKQILEHSNGNGNGNGKHHSATQVKDFNPIWVPPEPVVVKAPEFTPNDQPVLLERPSWWSHAFVWLIVGVTASGLIWAAVAPMEQAVPAQGKLEAEGATKELKVPNGGMVREVMVKDGDRVQKGQLLLVLDPRAPQADLDALTKQRDTLLRENQFYTQVNRSGTVAGNSELQALLESRQALMAENQYYKALFNGSQNPANNNIYLGNNSQDFNATQQGLLSVNRDEIRSRVAAVRLQVQQLETQLIQVRGQLEAAQRQLPQTRDRYLEAAQRLANGRNRLVTSERLRSTDEALLKQIAPLVEQGAIARLQLQRQEQQVLTRMQDMATIRDAIAEHQLDLSTRRSEVLNAQAEIHRLSAEEKRIIEAIAERRQQLQNAVASSAKEVFAKIADNQKRIAEIDSQIARIKLDNQKRLDEINSQIVKAQQSLQYQEVRAPMDGVVFDLKYNTPGLVVRSIDADPVLKIVPNEKLWASVYLTNRDIGFVKEGMEVEINVESFPSTEFGTLKGKLVSVGSDVLPPTQERPFYAFPAKIELERQSLTVNGREINLQSGMAVNATIKVRKRTVLSIFTELFQNSTDSLKTVR